MYFFFFKTKRIQYYAGLFSFILFYFFTFPIKRPNAQKDYILQITKLYKIGEISYTVVLKITEVTLKIYVLVQIHCRSSK